MLKHMINTGLIVAVIYVGLLFVIKHPFAMAMVGESKSMNKAPALKSTVTKPTDVETAKGTKIVGLKQRVNLSSPDDVQALWLSFQGMSRLQNQVRWDKAPIAVYAYYSDFSQDFTSATLSIGYQPEDVFISNGFHQFTLPSGKKQGYSFDTTKGTASDKAWAAAYLNNNSVERYELDAQGSIQSQQVFVYQ